MINVLISSTAYEISLNNSSSEGTTAIRLIEELTKKDFQFIAVGGNISPDLELDRASFINVNVIKDDLKLKNLMLMNLSGSYYLLRSALISRNIIKKKNIEIIHHMFPSSKDISFSLIPYLSPDCYGKPFIFGPICENIHSPMFSFIKNAHHKVCAKSDAIIVQTNDLHTRYYKLYGDKVCQIPLGVDTSKFCSCGRTDGSTIITVANLHYLKGVDLLIRAMVEVVKNVKDASLLIVGDGPQKQELMALTNKLNLKNHIEFLGNVPNNQMPGVLERANVFCSPSREEAFGRAMLEAAACGLPIVATSTCGATEIIENSDSGQLTPLNDPLSLAENIISLLQDREKRKKMADNGVRCMREKYDWGIISKKYEGVYRNAIGR